MRPKGQGARVWVGSGTAGLLPAVGWPRLRRFEVSDFLRRCLAAESEQRRLLPWVAVAFGAGCVLFFAADRPSLWAPVITALGCAAAAWRARARPVLFALAVAGCAVLAGFAAAILRTHMVATPVLARITTGTLSGFVETIEERPTGGRLVLRLTAFAGLAAEARPERARVTVRDLQGLAPGDHVSATARLLPPPEPARPGGYDFARDAYYKGLGAVGSIAGRVSRAEPPVRRDLALLVGTRIDAARNLLTRRIAEAIGGSAGAVAAALITGKRGLIDERTNDILRAAGIYHIVSISGLHMVLAAGTFFALARAALALIPVCALLWPIKKIAAVVGMIGATAYCVFSGADVATERSLIMILVMMGAVLFDRPALSLRNLAISAMIVLAREPEAVLGPSFQMSYAAVAGLVALAGAGRRHRHAEEGGRLRRALIGAAAAALGVLATTLVASLATGPFGSYHFQTLNPYGLIGNALTLPLVSFVVMPAAVLGVIAFPFGLDQPVWQVMGMAVAQVLRLSHWVSGFAGSTIVVPAFGPGALALFVVAILAATLLASRLRLAAIVPAAAAVWLASAPPRYDLYVARDGSGAALRGQDGRLVLLGRAPAFTAEQWLKADGDARKPADPSLAAGVRCDVIGCVARMSDGRAVALVRDRRGFAEDCARAAVVVSPLAAPPGCAAAHVIDGRFLAEHGATALKAKPEGDSLVTTRLAGELRPWLRPARPGMPARPPPAPRPAAAATAIEPAQ